MMQHEEDSLRQRVERLERQVEELQARLEARNEPLGLKQERKNVADKESTLFADEGNKVSPKAKPSVGAASQGKSWDFSDINGGSWLNRIGIVLILLGVLFLFKYSIDQGWITPPVRSLFGVLVGGTLLVSGMMADRERILFRQLLMGGGIAAFYITGFATFQLYDFLSPGIIWLFMIAVTVLALLLAVQQDEAVLSVLGTLGGLATPFMLYSGSGSLPGLMLYSILVMSGALGVYVFKGWGSLLGATAFGELLVLLTGLFVNVVGKTFPAETDQWALQAGIIFSVIVLWTLPVLRELLVGEKTAFRIRLDRRSSSVISILTLLVPVTALFVTSLTWDLKPMTAGWVALGGALLFYITFQSLRRRGIPEIKFAHLYASLILLTIALSLMLEGSWLLVALAAEAWAMQLIAKQLDRQRLSDVSHLLFLVTAYIAALNMVDRTGTGIPVFNGPALSELFVIAVGAMGIPLFLEEGSLKVAYRVASLAGLLGWLAHELSRLPDGQAYVSISWALVAVVLLAVGIQLNYRKARLAGMGTILLVVGKLLLYDLSELAAIWRIILFIGIGAVLLLLGYYFQPSWTRSASRDT